MDNILELVRVLKGVLTTVPGMNTMANHGYIPRSGQ